MPGFKGKSLSQYFNSQHNYYSYRTWMVIPFIQLVLLFNKIPGFSWVGALIRLMVQPIDLMIGSLFNLVTMLLYSIPAMLPISSTNYFRNSIRNTCLNFMDRVSQSFIKRDISLLWSPYIIHGLNKTPKGNAQSPKTDGLVVNSLTLNAALLRREIWRFKGKHFNGIRSPEKRVVELINLLRSEHADKDFICLE